MLPTSHRELSAEPALAVLRAVSRSVVILILFLVSQFASDRAAALKASEFKLTGDARNMRIVIQFDREPDPKWFLLRDPDRLVIDLPQTAFLVEPNSLRPRGLIRNVRYGALNEERSRLILTVNGPFAVDKFNVTTDENGQGFRLITDISTSSDRLFDQALADQTLTTGTTVSTPKGDRVRNTAADPGKRFTVVVDAGHGGIDGGAEGLNGSVEKTFNLAFALELSNRLIQTGQYDVYLTRGTDEFLSLEERVRLARQHGADLLISIHADAISRRSIRGATVYTVSDKPSDAEAQATADRENLSDTLAGLDVNEENHEVADILVDLIRRETHTYSVRFARALVDQLSPTIGLINHPQRSAGFKVLKAPDMPSVLIELGYLSNAKDEEQLRNPEWRAKVADRVAAAIAEFAVAKTASGG